MSKGKVREWKEEYSQFAFTATTVDGVERPQCILCGVVFCNFNLKPSKLSEYFKNKHKRVETKYNAETLKTKRARDDLNETLREMGFTSFEKSHLIASYKVGYRIAKEMKTHTLAEKLIKPYVVDMVGIVLRNGAARKLKQVVLSNDTVGRGINDLIIDISNQLISDFKASSIKLLLQLVASPDVFTYSQLICFVRYIKEKKVERVFVL